MMSVNLMSFMKKHKNDILLVLAALILGAAFLVYTEFFRPDGAEVVISVDGNEHFRLPLSEDTRLTYGEGEVFNTLVISGGEAWIEDASCPDHICVKSGKVSLEGETIVCLPNKLVISIAGGEENALDGIAG